MRFRKFLAFFGYLLFVVYGSLMPFDYREHTMDAALAQFENIPYLNLDAGSRADWVANIVLYFPLAFLGCLWGIGLRSLSPLRHLTAIAVLAFCLSVAVAVEFAQIFFAPRTVSLNDLLAEGIGTLLGVSAFGLGRWQIARLWQSFARGGRESVQAVAWTFGLAYAALALFPYDFVISWSELREQLASNHTGWLLAGECGDGLRCAARQFGEAAAVAPLGLLIALAAGRAERSRFFAAGIALGATIELLQLLLVSGVSQGLSILWRGLGLAAGAAIGQVFRQRGPEPIAWAIRRATILAAPFYIGLAMALNGWFSAGWIAPDRALSRIAELKFLPFYYHYFSTESAAMSSLIAQAGLYAPLGLAMWAFFLARNAKVVAVMSGLAAIALALPIELGKLFVADKHPDLTNLLIAGGSAAIANAMAFWTGRALVHGDRASQERRLAASAHFGVWDTRTAPETAPRVRVPKPPPHPLGLAVGLAALLPIGYGVSRYPAGKVWLTFALAAYGALIARRPQSAFFLLPALAAGLDLSPVTGTLLLNEFDLFVLVALAILYPKLYRTQPVPWASRWLAVSLAALWASWFAASARGLWPLPSLSAGVLDSSHSALEAWLAGKGILWALTLAPPLRRVAAVYSGSLPRLVLRGLLAGLAAVALAVTKERAAFVGLLDFDNPFRVTGTFSDMRTGGAYIEAFIAFAFPALVFETLAARAWVWRAAGVAAAVVVCYAMLVTFSRGGYAGLLAGFAATALLARAGADRQARRWPIYAGLAAAVVAAAVPVLSGSFAQSRLARSADDLSIRKDHWRRALNLMDPGATAALFGMGFGQYPTRYALLADSDKPPGAYRVVYDDHNHFLRLSAGETVFLDQLVSVENGGRYTFSAWIRQPEETAALSVAVCEKALLYSFGCEWRTLKPKTPKRWDTPSVEIGPLALTDGWPSRPTKLSLHNPGPGLIDLDNIGLADEEGRQLTANGSFAEGAKRWLFVADQDLAWHIHQQEVEMYFAQGWLGLAVLAFLAVGVAKSLRSALAAGHAEAAAWAGAFAGFLTVGLLGSTMDEARLSMLFYLGAFCAGSQFKSDGAKRG